MHILFYLHTDMITVFAKRFVFSVSKLLLTVKITGHFVEQVNNHQVPLVYLKVNSSSFLLPITGVNSKVRV